MKLTILEKKLVEYAKRNLKKHSVRDLEDNCPNPGSFVLSSKNNIYHGIAFDDRTGRIVHGEINVLATMATEENYNSKIKIILIVGPDEKICLPCKRCKKVIDNYKNKNTSILCTNLDLSKIKKI